MARKPDISGFKTFEQITDRLDEIIGQVRDKDTSLERSLDLFDEAIALGSKAVDLVDSTDFSPAELERMKEVPTGGSPEGADGESGADVSPEGETGA